MSSDRPNKGSDSHGNSQRRIDDEDIAMRGCDGRELLLDEYEELLSADWMELLRQGLTMISTLFAFGLLVCPETIACWVDAVGSLASSSDTDEEELYISFTRSNAGASPGAATGSAAGAASGQRGPAAHEEWMIWKATAYKVLLFAAILVVVAALEQELQEVLELFMALRSRDDGSAVRGLAKAGFDLTLASSGSGSSSSTGSSGGLPAAAGYSSSPGPAPPLGRKQATACCDWLLLLRVRVWPAPT